MQENEKCPLGLCDGSGVVIYEDNTFSECQCRKAMHLQNYLSSALIPSGYMNKTFEDFRVESDEHKKIVSELKAYVDDWEALKEQGIGISMISNQTRTGKSHCACAVAHALIEKYQRSIDHDLVVFINVTNWIDWWKAFFSRFPKDQDEQFVDMEERQRQINRLCDLDTRMNECELLILDDIGEVPGSQFVNSKLYSVVEYRTSRNKPILITSNHPWERIQLKYENDGPRIVDRLKEKSLEYTFYFDKPMKKKERKSHKK